MGIFNKISSKKPNSADEQDEHPSLYDYSSQQSSPTKAPTKPPTTRPSGSRSPTKKPTSQRSASPPSREPKTQSPRTSRPFGRYPTDAGRRKKIDPDTHPLNLPPEERERKRLSELSAMSARTSMDFEKETVNGGNPSSPPSQPPPPPYEEQPPPPPPPPRSANPPSSHQNSFTVPVTNGTDASTNGPADEEVPPPPPHRSQPSSPAQSEAEKAESFKNEGNKFFKAGDYAHAIEFYTKGEKERESK